MSVLNRGLLAVFTAFLLSACASAPAGRVGGDRSVLTTEEMQKVGNANLLQVVQALRPHWLSTRGRDSIYAQGDVVVFMDGVQYGSPATLESINSSTVSELRYFDGPTATARWGLCCGHGVIYITTLAHQANPT